MTDADGYRGGEKGRGQHNHQFAKLRDESRVQAGSESQPLTIDTIWATPRLNCCARANALHKATARGAQNLSTLSIKTFAHERFAFRTLSDWLNLYSTIFFSLVLVQDCNLDQLHICTTTDAPRLLRHRSRYYNQTVVVRAKPEQRIVTYDRCWRGMSRTQKIHVVIAESIRQQPHALLFGEYATRNTQNVTWFAARLFLAAAERD